MAKTAIANESHLLKEASRELRGVLKERGIVEDIIFDIYVGFEEALWNAMIHGNRENPSKKVTVETEITRNTVMICVEDEGEGFDPEMLPDPTLDENLLKEGGRGVYLMKHLMDDVRFENGGKRVVMMKYLKQTLKDGGHGAN